MVVEEREGEMWAAAGGQDDSARAPVNAARISDCEGHGGHTVCAFESIIGSRVLQLPRGGRSIHEN